MSVLHIFNPSHDEALAANTSNYTPTRAARLLEKELFSLPSLWANPGDSVLSFDKTFGDAEYQSCVLTAHPDWDNTERIEPWGWDAALCGRLLRLGAPQRLLPTDDYLSMTRRVSSRESAVTLLAYIKKEMPNVVGESVFCHTLDETGNCMAAFGGEAMLKAPWSCSGRGVFRASLSGPAAWERRTAKILRQQGGIAVEAWQKRVADFAMEFEITPAGAHYIGLSVFSTNPVGGYSGNIVAKEDLLHGFLPPGIRNKLPDVRRLIINALDEGLLSGYSGPVGVDMMVVDYDGEQCLVPCVEINVRRTMGFAALCLHRFLPSPGSSATFSIVPTSAVISSDVFLTDFSDQIAAVLRLRANA